MSLQEPRHLIRAATGLNPHDPTLNIEEAALECVVSYGAEITRYGPGGLLSFRCMEAFYAVRGIFDLREEALTESTDTVGTNDDKPYFLIQCGLTEEPTLYSIRAVPVPLEHHLFGKGKSASSKLRPVKKGYCKRKGRSLWHVVDPGDEDQCIDVPSLVIDQLSVDPHADYSDPVPVPRITIIGRTTDIHGTPMPVAGLSLKPRDGAESSDQGTRGKLHHPLCPCAQPEYESYWMASCACPDLGDATGLTSLPTHTRQRTSNSVSEIQMDFVSC